jgi:hypothetical protein
MYLIKTSTESQNQLRKESQHQYIAIVFLLVQSTGEKVNDVMNLSQGASCCKSGGQGQSLHIWFSCHGNSQAHPSKTWCYMTGKKSSFMA